MRTMQCRMRSMTLRPNSPNNVRQPAVAGYFYEDNPQVLSDDISSYLKEAAVDTHIRPGCLGVVCPHAGYVYSGVVAARSFLEISDGSYPYVLMVGPDHAAAGPPAAYSSYDTWRTPLGETEVTYEGDIIQRCDIKSDVIHHDREHSLEVQLPFIQHIFGQIPVSPILLADQSRRTATKLGQSLAKQVSNPAMIASSDLTHYEPDDTARQQDRYLIDNMLDMDIAGFYRTLREKRVTACGYGAIACVMQYCIERGGSVGRLLKYQTSGKRSGRYDSVVGYCSVAFY